MRPFKPLVSSGSRHLTVLLYRERYKEQDLLDTYLKMEPSPTPVPDIQLLYRGAKLRRSHLGQLVVIHDRPAATRPALDDVARRRLRVRLPVETVRHVHGWAEGVSDELRRGGRRSG